MKELHVYHSLNGKLLGTYKGVAELKGIPAVLYIKQNGTLVVAPINTVKVK